MRFWHSICSWIVLVATAAATVPADAVDATRGRLQRAVSAAAAAPKAAMIARADFQRPAAIVDVQLAPDGLHLAYQQRDRELRVGVWLQHIASGKRTRVARDVGGVELAWSGDGRRLWLADAQGLAVVDVASLATQRIKRWDRRLQQRLWQVDASTPGHAIVHEQQRGDGPARHRYLLISHRGQESVLHAARWPLRSVRLTAAGRLAYSAGYEGAQHDTVVRRHAADGVHELMRCTGIERCDVLAYSAEANTVWLLSQHGEARTALMRWDAVTNKLTTVHRDPAAIADAEAVLWDGARDHWLAVSYRSDGRHWYGRDARIDAQLGALSSKLPSTNLSLATTSAGDLWLVTASRSDRSLDRHYLYRPEAGHLQPLFVDVLDDELDGLSSALAVDWRASDGMLLHGYLYLPRGVPAGKAPIVAWLHGGPIGRSSDDYDARIQLLVNRGCVVFAPNFRASTGYGLAYTRAANGDVGHGRVLADVIEGLDFLLAEGIGDRARQAIAGHSFGGYAGLLAVSHHQARFRFAFAGAPPTDYGWIKQWQAEHDSIAIRGDGPPLSLQFAQHRMDYTDPAWRARMRRDAPLTLLPKLRTPVYLWAGANDPNVPLTSIARYAADAARLEKQVALLIDPDAEHAPRRPLNAEAWLYLLERAVDRHFGGGTTPPSPTLDAFLRANLRIDTAGLHRQPVPAAQPAAGH